MSRLVERLLSKVSRVLGSGWMFWAIVFLFITQALYVAVLFRYPLVYDEQFHLNVIKAFSHYLSPIIFNQPQQYDSLGNLTFGNASLYHYLMSFPYRFIEVVTEHTIVQVVFMRILNIALATSALFVFAKFFRELGIRRVIVNLGLFIYVCIPMVSTIAATINYDNMLLPLTALFLLYSGRLVRTPAHQWQPYVTLISIGLAASLIKFTFLPIFVVGLAFVGIIIYRNRPPNFVSHIWRSFTKTRKTTLTLWTFVFVALLAIAGFRYGVSVLKYHTPIPSCTQTMSVERCMANPVTSMEQNALKTKHERKSSTPIRYTENWWLLMVNGYTLTSANTDSGTETHVSPKLYYDAFVGGFVGGLLVLIYMWRDLRKNNAWYLAITLSFALIGSTLLFNILSFYQFNANVNVQPRYALSVLPIIIIFSGVAVDVLMRNYARLKMLLLVCIVFLTLQGGGVVTHITGSQDDWYWNKKPVLEVSRAARSLISPFILYK